jgi:hypothetical protein
VQPQPGRPRQKRLRRFRMSRDENGNLVGEELDPVGAAPVADAWPTPEAAPEPSGMFAGVFGSPDA